MSSVLMKILPSATIGFLGSSTSFTISSSTPGMPSVLLKICLHPTNLGIL
ncbi:hypothetical protein A2U01_0082979, partial [Trifolium medium]|nr:hypothetical protein [Trifolium medium]